MLYTGFPGLDILPRSRLKRQIALGGGLAALLISAELSNGYVTGAVRWLKRSGNPHRLPIQQVHVVFEEVDL